MTAATFCRSGDLIDHASHVEGLCADVDGRHGKAVDLAAAAGHVQVVDAGRPRAERLTRLPDHPARCVDRALVIGERRGPGEIANAAIPERGLVLDLDGAVMDAGEAVEKV